MTTSSKMLEEAIAAVKAVTESIDETKAEIQKTADRIVAMHQLIDVLANMITLLSALINPRLITEEARAAYAQQSREAMALSEKIYGIRPTPQPLVPEGVKI